MKVRECTYEFTAREVGSSLYGLRYLGDTEEVRRVASREARTSDARETRKVASCDQSDESFRARLNPFQNVCQELLKATRRQLPSFSTPQQLPSARPHAAR